MARSTVSTLPVIFLVAACGTPQAAPVSSPPPPLPSRDAAVVAPSGPPFRFSHVAVASGATRGEALAALAKDVLLAYRNDDRAASLDTTFRLHMVAGDPAAALGALESLRALPESGVSPQTRANRVPYAIVAAARVRLEQRKAASLDEAFPLAFREALAGCDDRTAALVIRALGVDRAYLHQAFDQALRALEANTSLSIAEAVSLLRAYQIDQAYDDIAPRIAPLIDEDDARRYAIARDIQIRSGTATLCALVVRPPGNERVPALLNFTIYDDTNAGATSNVLAEARRTASNGYAGVIGFTRGKGCSPDVPVAYEHDGEDAAAVVDWIARQPYSDGRVGMYGGSYEGFTQWAAAKHMPKALKGLMPSVAVAPGIDVPMDGSVFQSFVYYWPFYTASSKYLDDAAMSDRERWNRLETTWYKRGSAYRTMDQIDGTPNPFFDRWLEHPAYDAYWQKMGPHGADFAKITIPILSTTGYYDGAQLGAIHYVLEHARHTRHAEHYLVIGPYDHIRGQRGTVTRFGETLTNLDGYETDPVARLDVGELRYQWFDYLFKGAPKPALLAGNVNYEVMGQNVWKHAASIEAMGPAKRRFYLSAARSGDAYLFAEAGGNGATGNGTKERSITLTVDLADRSDIDREAKSRGGIVDAHIDPWNGLTFASPPLEKETEVSGLFSGHLELVANKRDFDISIELYEQRAANGGNDYVSLSTHLQRASFARDRSHRQLLVPGQPAILDFKSGRLTSRLFAAGSRVVVVLSVVKRPAAQINYGTGKEVSDETIADAKEPLVIRWLDTSFIELPIGNGP